MAASLGWKPYQHPPEWSRARQQERQFTRRNVAPVPASSSSDFVVVQSSQSNQHARIAPVPHKGGSHRGKNSS